VLCNNLEHLRLTRYSVLTKSRKLGEVENESTSRKLILFAIFVPKIFTVGGNLTKFWQK